MALEQIDYTSPKFIALSTDIVNNRIDKLGYVGAIVYLTDITTGNPHRIVNSDLTLSEYLGYSVNANIISSTPLSVVVDPNITLNTNIISSNPITTIIDSATPVSIILNKSILSSTQIGLDRTISWANSALVNTCATPLDITIPTSPIGEYMITVNNPSTVTDLTVKVFSIAMNLAGGTKYSFLQKVSIPKTQVDTGTAIDTYTRLLHGIFNGTNIRIVLSNDTALGASDGFTATLRLQEVM